MTLASRRLLIASDLDGTLLDSTRAVTTRMAAVAARLQAAGWPLVLATALPVRDVRPIAAALGTRSVAICGNGSMCFDFATERVLEQHPIDPQTALRIITRIRAVHPLAQFGAERELELVLEEGFVLDPRVIQEAARVSALETMLDARGFGKLIVQLPGAAGEYLTSLRATLPVGQEIVHSSSAFCEITRDGVTKASALAAIAARLGFGAEDVVAFGDMPNDVAMLAWAGTGVAVVSAHPDVLAIADDITESNDRDGVARWLEERLNGHS
jgi:hydroxymethylpyrimidine pyrophosphatase-like HAD family hydrolase